MDRYLKKLKQLIPAKPDKASDPEPKEAPRAPSDDLYARLQGVPGRAEAWRRRALILCRDKVEGQGEDAFLATRAGGRVLLGAFDGCGGSGAKVYPAFGGHTGAWVASRAVALAARDWFLSVASGNADDDLAAHAQKWLAECRAGEPGGQVLMGSLSRDFPTTLAAFSKRVGSDEFDFYWCGDSRCYVLDGDGLHQVSTDDADVADAMRNLREDAPMTNVISASRPFVIHERRLRLEKPSVVIAATDGCFGYLPSPIAFERLLLETLDRASNLDGWRQGLDERLREVSGDDYTLVAWPHRFASYRAIKRGLGERFEHICRQYPQADASEEALFEQWEGYRPGYESLLPSDAEHQGRG